MHHGLWNMALAETMWDLNASNCAFSCVCFKIACVAGPLLHQRLCAWSGGERRLSLWVLDVRRGTCDFFVVQSASISNRALVRGIDFWGRECPNKWAVCSECLFSEFLLRCTALPAWYFRHACVNQNHPEPMVEQVKHLTNTSLLHRFPSDISWMLLSFVMKSRPALKMTSWNGKMLSWAQSRPVAWLGDDFKARRCTLGERLE